MNLVELYRQKTISRWTRQYKASYFNTDKVWLICVKPTKAMPHWMAYTGLPLSVQFLDIFMHKQGSWEKYLAVIDEKGLSYKVKRRGSDSFLWFKTEQDCLTAIETYVQFKYDIRTENKIPWDTN